MTSSLKQWDKVEVFWVDSVHDSGWQRLAEYKEESLEDKNMEHSSVGYYLHDNPKSIVICQSRGYMSVRKNNESIDAVMQIPKVAIVKIKKLRS